MSSSRTLLALAMCAGSSTAHAATLELVSAPAVPSVPPPNGASANARASADLRYVVFDSYADNLVAGDANGRRDVLLFDRALGGPRTLVSSGGNGDSSGPDITADGARVVFASDADNLVAGDTNGASDIFVYERTTGALIRIVPAGGEANGASRDARISADGTHVAFVSAATNWLAGDTNGVDDIYVVTLATGAVARASLSDAGSESTTAVRAPSVSADGRCVGFESNAADLVASDTNDRDDFFVRDVVAGSTRRDSVSWQGQQAPRGVVRGSGRVFACDRSMFASLDMDLGALPGFGLTGVYVRASGLVELRHGLPSTGMGLATSTNGRWLLVGSDDQFFSTVPSLRVDLVDGSTTELAGRRGAPSAIADDGALLIARTDVPVRVDDRNALSDLVLFSATAQGSAWLTARPAGAPPELVADGASGRANLDDPITPGAPTRHHAISDDGRYALFNSLATNLVAGDTNGVEDVFLRDRTLGTTTRLSVTPQGFEANGLSRAGDISGDGRFVVFESCATNLVPADTNGLCDVFRLDRNDGSIVRVNVSSAGDEANQMGSPNRGHWPRVSVDGRYVAFVSRSTNFIPGPPGTANRVYRRDVTAGTTELVGSGTTLAMTPDGQTIVTATAGSIIAHDGAGATTVYSPSDGSATADWPSISDDGRYVAFYSNDPNVVAGDTNDAFDVFVHDRQSGARTLVSRPVGAATGSVGGSISEISGNGRYVAYLPNALPNGAVDPRIIRVDLLEGGVDAFVTAQDTLAGRDVLSRPRLTPNGGTVVFTATGLSRSAVDPAGDMYGVYVGFDLSESLFRDGFE